MLRIILANGAPDVNYKITEMSPNFSLRTPVFGEGSAALTGYCPGVPVGEGLCLQTTKYHIYVTEAGKYQAIPDGRD